MLIGELARRTGCSRDTIRFYGKLGLIAPERRPRGGNNYKRYDEATVDRELLIKQAKLLGFTLAEIKDLMQAWEAGGLSRDQKRKIFTSKIELIESRISELKRVISYLRRKLERL